MPVCCVMNDRVDVVAVRCPRSTRRSAGPVGRRELDVDDVALWRVGAGRRDAPRTSAAHSRDTIRIMPTLLLVTARHKHRLWRCEPGHVTPSASVPVVARTPSAEYLVLDIETVPDHRAVEARPNGRPACEPPFPPTWAHRDRRDRLSVARPRLPAQAARRDRRADGGEGTSDRARAHAARGLLALRRTRAAGARHVQRPRFDLPVIALRSLCHGVPLGWYYRERNVRYRYSEEGHLDLCDWLADHGATRSGSLDAVARLIGLPGKVGVDGSQVEGLYRAGQLAAIQRYCLVRRRADRAAVPALPPAAGRARAERVPGGDLGDAARRARRRW